MVTFPTSLSPRVTPPHLLSPVLGPLLLFSHSFPFRAGMTWYIYFGLIFSDSAEFMKPLMEHLPPKVSIGETTPKLLLPEF